MASAQSRLRKTLRDFLYVPVVKKSIEMMPVARKIYPPVQRTHPFDQQHGIDTSGFVGVEQIHHDKKLRPLINPYSGSRQAETHRAGRARRARQCRGVCIHRSRLRQKGRATTVASEFPFREIIGWELSADLAKTARANAAKIAAKFPKRSPVRIVEGNVVDIPFAAGQTGFFFSYHAFRARARSRRDDEAVRSRPRRRNAPHIFFVYYNPVHPEAFDASPAFSRFYVRQIPYDASEIGFRAGEWTTSSTIWRKQTRRRDRRMRAPAASLS